MWATALCLLLLLGCSARSYQVVRLLDGQPVRGRAISPEAYGAFARAAEADQRGQQDAALAWYGRVLELDPESVEAWTRIGALRCLLDQSGADDAFSAASELDQSYAPLWRERARCAERRGELPSALAAAERAAALDPDDLEVTLVLARVSVALGDRARGRRWLEAAVLRMPTARPAWHLLGVLAEQDHDPLLAARCSSALRALESLDPSERRAHAQRGFEAALHAHDLPRARVAALELRLAPATVALEAVRAGRSALALEQAWLVLEADPSSADAWVAALVAADLERDEGRFDAALAALGEEPGPLSEAARQALDELLRRRVGVGLADESKLPDP